MNLKTILRWFWNHVRSYNRFMPEENDYDDDADDEQKDPATALRHQKYATWLYVLLTIGKQDKHFSFSEHTITDELIIDFHGYEILLPIHFCTK